MLGRRPKAQEQQARSQPQCEVEPPAPCVQEQREGDDSLLEADPDGSSQGQEEVETPRETIQPTWLPPAPRRSSCPSSSSRQGNGRARRRSTGACRAAPAP